ncbi:hypothetical protein C8Q76DRAFT_763087 [Earliella scabrosa]|nr:hypothetical protein C8Q76DRAFT_763087 [Earliella scabrosa]
MSTHEALENGDILYSVCAVLADSSESGTLARLARVNRLFNECATPSLWRKLNSLLPLFKILSNLMVSPERNHRLSGEVYEWGGISTGEWRRFRLYASYVRELDVFTTGRIFRIEPRSWVHLTVHAHGEPLLPNLRKLRWSVRFVECPALQFLVAPSLEDLSVYFYSHPALRHRGSTAEWEACITSFLALVSSTVVRLASMSIFLGHRLYSPSVLPLVSRLRSLRNLSLVTRKDNDAMTMTTDELHVLSPLHELESLTLCCPMQMGVTRPPVPIGLPALRSLTLHHPGESASETKGICNMFVHPSSPTMLTELVVQDCPPTALHDSCQAWTQLYPSLQRFTASLTLADDLPAPGMQSLAYTIEPLLHLRGIEHFSFSGRVHNVTLADADIVAISRAWPALTNLCIDLHDYPRPPREPPTRPGFAALVSLATQCPNLEQLGLPFLDLRVRGQADGSLGMNSTLSHSRLRELVCGPVVLDDVSEDAPPLAAELVDRLFPSLTMTASWSLSKHSQQDQAVADSFRLALQRRQEARRDGRMRNEANVGAT